MPFPEVEAVQVKPSVLDARRFVPSPPANQRDPFHDMERHKVNIEFPFVVEYHVIPSAEYAKIFLP
jgi:hypothetical protein